MLVVAIVNRLMIRVTGTNPVCLGMGYKSKTRTNAAKLATAAAAAKIMSILLISAVAGRGGAAALGAAPETARGAAVGAADAVGATAAAGPEVPGGRGAEVGMAAAVETGVAATGVGNLMVGAVVGLGGKLMRTVSFLGCTLAASAGRGGTAPCGIFGIFGIFGVFGIFSAIFHFFKNARDLARWCQTHILCHNRFLSRPFQPENEPGHGLPGARLTTTHTATPQNSSAMYYHTEFRLIINRGFLTQQY